MIVAVDRGAILMFARRYDEAASQFLAVLAVEPGPGRAYLVVEAYAEQGRYAEALALLDRGFGDGFGLLEAQPLALACVEDGRVAEHDQA